MIGISIMLRGSEDNSFSVPTGVLKSLMSVYKFVTAMIKKSYL